MACFVDRQYKTFFGDDIWRALTEQAHFDNKLTQDITVNEIAASWITKDRLPVLNVVRNYGSRTVTLTQVSLYTIKLLLPYTVSQIRLLPLPYIENCKSYMVG